MILSSPGDVAFSLFGIPIYYYGIILSVSISLGVWVAYKLFKHFYESEFAPRIIDMSPWIILLGILGARLYYCLVNSAYYFQNPYDILNIREGGLSIHGMIVIGIISLWLFAKHYKIKPQKVFDVFACATPLAQSIGRWGNFFNSEAFGVPYDGWLKLYIPQSSRPWQYLNYEYFHPTFLYESILNFLVFLILLIAFKKCSKYPGTVLALYLILYGCVRFIVERIRVDSILNIAQIPIAQIFSVFLVIAGLFYLIYISKNKIDCN